MKIGFIGLGRMGSAMATNLVKAGHDVTVFNRSPEKSLSLLDIGARRAASIAGACDGEAVITMLADDAAAAHIAFEDDGIIRKLPTGAIHVSMSTISVTLSKQLAKAHVKAGQRFVAAPGFGRPEIAPAANLFAFPCRSVIFYTNDFSASSLRVVTTSIGPQSAALQRRTRAMVEPWIVGK